MMIDLLMRSWMLCVFSSGSGCLLLVIRRRVLVVRRRILHLICCVNHLIHHLVR